MSASKHSESLSSLRGCLSLAAPGCELFRQCDGVSPCQSTQILTSVHSHKPRVCPRYAAASDMTPPLNYLNHSQTFNPHVLRSHSSQPPLMLGTQLWHSPAQCPAPLRLRQSEPGLAKSKFRHPEFRSCSKVRSSGQEGSVTISAGLIGHGWSHSQMSEL